MLKFEGRREEVNKGGVKCIPQDAPHRLLIGLAPPPGPRAEGLMLLTEGISASAESRVNDGWSQPSDFKAGRHRRDGLKETEA